MTESSVAFVENDWKRCCCLNTEVSTWTVIGVLRAFVEVKTLKWKDMNSWSPTLTPSSFHRLSLSLSPHVFECKLSFTVKNDSWYNNGTQHTEIVSFPHLPTLILITVHIIFFKCWMAFYCSGFFLSARSPVSTAVITFSTFTEACCFTDLA